MGLGPIVGRSALFIGPRNTCCGTCWLSSRRVFNLKRNVTYQRFVFNKYHQGPRETVGESVTKLRSLSSTREFGIVATSRVVLLWLCDSPQTGFARRTKIYMRGASEKAIIREIAGMISVVACCDGAKLCAHAARDFRPQQNGAVTRMWGSCGVQPLHKERAIGVVRCKKEGMLLQPPRWCCVDCVIHHERDVREEQKYICVARASNNKRDCEHDLYCCLLPRCKALRTCRSGFPIATVCWLMI